MEGTENSSVNKAALEWGEELNAQLPFSINTDVDAPHVSLPHVLLELLKSLLNCALCFLPQ